MGRGIYAVANRVTGKAYIGSAVNVRRRWADHRRALRRGSHSNAYLQASWDRHGEDAFDFIVVEEVPDALSLVEREQAWLDAMRTFERERGYNLSPTAYSVLGYRFTPEQRTRLSVAMTGKAKSAEHRANTWANREVTDEHRVRVAAIGRAGAGVPKSTEHRRRIGASQRGSANHGAKLTEPIVADIRRRLANGERGRHLAAEYGVHESIISEIKSGRIWRHVTTQGA